MLCQDVKIDTILDRLMKHDVKPSQSLVLHNLINEALNTLYLCLQGSKIKIDIDTHALSAEWQQKFAGLNQHQNTELERQQPANPESGPLQPKKKRQKGTQAGFFGPAKDDVIVTSEKKLTALEKIFLTLSDKEAKKYNNHKNKDENKEINDDNNNNNNEPETP